MTDNAPKTTGPAVADPVGPSGDLARRLAEIDNATVALTQHARRLADAEALDDLQVIRDATATLGDVLSMRLPPVLGDGDPTALGQLRHEIHNHLNHIIGLSELVAESELLGADAEAASGLATLRRSGGGFLELVREKLTGPVDRRNVGQDDTPAPPDSKPEEEHELASEPAGNAEPNQFAASSSPTRDFEAFMFMRSEPRGQATEDDVTTAEPEDLAEPEPVVERRVEPCDILVVDDDKVNRETLGRWVEQLGHRVHQADGGASGLSMVADGHYDLILLDVLMPDMNG